jgi:hypothetical protein
MVRNEEAGNSRFGPLAFLWHLILCKNGGNLKNVAEKLRLRLLNFESEVVLSLAAFFNPLYSNYILLRPPAYRFP